MRWPQRRCLTRHLRRAALVSLITASSNGFSTADQPQAELAPVQKNQYAMPALTGETKGPLSQPRIIAYTAAEQVGEPSSIARHVRLIESQVQLNPLAIVQTAAPDSPAESKSTLEFRVPAGTDSVPQMIGNPAPRSTLKLRSNETSPRKQPPVGESRSVLSIVPQRHVAPAEADAEVTFSISDDSLSIPPRPQETTPVELVRPRRAAVVEVVESPRQIPLVKPKNDPAKMPIVERKQVTESSAPVEPSTGGQVWKMPKIRPLVNEDPADEPAGRIAAKPRPKENTESANVASSKPTVAKTLTEDAPLPLVAHAGQARFGGMLEGADQKTKSVLDKTSVTKSQEPTPQPTLVRENKVVVDVPPADAIAKPKSVADRAVVAIKSTMDLEANLVTRSQFAVSVAESRMLFAGDRIVRVSVEHPDVCNAVTTGKESVMVVGRKLGRTRVAIWTESTPNLEPELYVVQVDGAEGESEDQRLAGQMTGTVASMFSEANVKVHVVEDGFAVSGTAETESQARKIMQVVRSACLRRVRDEIVVR
ncbi:hypothetical protein Poly24_11130 [Rosistilla carotiformis]|uniref:Pilus formation protein N-terminal domain-containing protein n=1 Tax=Rosistilla carotiformis TaxID=2528017 RepID=A0A518JPH7_9BACT|nr:pilus assembly protein N-terminal domain-containing protein [Rosistilla carotiformis]QDV67418.1 hypothetical protein Poly24_11130 [Rosistilla carotiformis]